MQRCISSYQSRKEHLMKVFFASVALARIISSSGVYANVRGRSSTGTCSDLPCCEFGDADARTYTSGSLCPGNDIVVSLTTAFPKTRFRDDIAMKRPFSAGVGSNYAVWAQSNKRDTLQCYPFRGSSFNVTETETTKSESISGNFLAFFFEDEDCSFDGVNTANVTSPGLYYVDGGTWQYVYDKADDTYVNTRVTGQYDDICATIRAALESDGDGDTCEDKDRIDCMGDNNCKWQGKCVMVPWK